MQQIAQARKKRRHPKDWERRARVVSAMSARQVTVTELARSLKVSQGYVSAVIWGVDRVATMEARIASKLGCSWAELFAPEADRRAA